MIKKLLIACSALMLFSAEVQADQILSAPPQVDSGNVLKYRYGSGYIGAGVVSGGLLTIQPSQLPAITGGDVTAPAGSVAHTVNTVKGKAVLPLDGTLPMTGPLTAPGVGDTTSVDLRKDCGGKDDGTTDNLPALNTCLARIRANGSGKGTLHLTKSAAGIGSFYLSTTPNLAGVTLDMDNKNTGFGNFNSASAGMPNMIGATPIGAENGLRPHAPGYDEIWLGPTGDQTLFHAYLHRDGIATSPYNGYYMWRAYTLDGQNAPTTGSSGAFFLNELAYMPTYDGNGNQLTGVGNGAGFPMICTATNGSSNLTNCTLVSNGANPLATNPATGQPYLNGATNLFASGLPASGAPAGVGSTSNNAATIPMTTPDTSGTPLNWTGSTGTVTVTAIVGHAEHNLLTLHGGVVGTITTTGPNSGANQNWYNEITQTCGIGTIAAAQDGFCTSILAQSFKTNPGSIHDALHIGSDVMTLATYGSGPIATYPHDAILNIAGYTGPANTLGGGASGATYGATDAIRVGGYFLSIYQNPRTISYFQNGLHLSNYEGAGILLDTPNNKTSPYVASIAIKAMPGAGNTLLGTASDTGTPLSVGPSASTQFAYGAINASLQNSGSSSHRTGMLFDATPGGGAKWLLATDKNQSGSSDFFLYDTVSGRFVLDADPSSGNVTFGASIGFGTYTNTACTNAGFISITDSAGTARKVQICN